MNKYRIVVWVLVIMMFSACSLAPKIEDATAEEEQEYKAQETLADDSLATGTVKDEGDENAAQNGSSTTDIGEDSILVQDTNIEEIDIDAIEKARSSDNIFEDKDHIYVMIHRTIEFSSILCIDKGSGEIYEITDAAYDFTVTEGLVFYTSKQNDRYKIVRYNVEENSYVDIIVSNERLKDLACSVGMVYFVSIIDMSTSENISTLYSCDHFGNNINKIGAAPGAYIVYDKTIYGVTAADPGELIVYTENGDQDIIYPSVYDEIFDISHGELICTEVAASERNISGRYIIDIETAQGVVLPEPITDDDYVLGQYIFYEVKPLNNDKRFLCAYDFEKNQFLTLCEIEESVHIFATTTDTLFLSSLAGDRITLLKLVIHSGIASIAEIITIE